MTDYLGLADLLALDIDRATAHRILKRSPLTGHDGQPVVEAWRLQELIDLDEQEAGDGA